MHQFILVRATSGERLDRIRERLRERALERVSFWGESHYLLEDRSRGLLAFGTATAVPGATTPVAFQGEPRGPWVFCNGTPLFAEDDPARDHAQFAREIEADGVDPLWERIEGTYQYVVTQRDGRIDAFWDFAQFHPVFHAEGSGFCALSNRQLLLDLVLRDGAQPTFDPEVLSWLTGQGNIFGRRCQVAGVRRTLGGEYLTVPAGSPVVTIGRHGEQLLQRHRFAREPSPSDFEAITGTLVEQMAAFGRSHAGPIRLTLTGGRDSRVNAALLAASGLAGRVEEALTWGVGEDPEVRTAAAVAARLGLPHTHQSAAERSYRSDHQWRSMFTHAARFESGVPSWDPGGGASVRRNRVINGMGGEIFSKHVRRHNRMRDLDWERARVVTIGYQQPDDPLGVQRPAVTAAQRAVFDALLAEYEERGADPNDLTDLFFIDHRIPMWSGLTTMNGYRQYRYFPMVNRRAAFRAFELGYRHRQEERFHFEILRAVDPGLTRIPFVGAAFSPEIRSIAASTGIEVPDEPWKHWPKARENTPRWFLIDQDLARVRAFLLDDPGSPLFDLYDRAALERVLTEEDPLTWSRPQGKAVYSLVDLQIALTGQARRALDGPTDRPARCHLSDPAASLTLPDPTLAISAEHHWQTGTLSIGGSAG